VCHPLMNAILDAILLFSSILLGNISQGAHTNAASLMALGRLKFAARCQEAGVRFSDGGTFGACVAQVVVSEGREIRRF